MEEILRIEKFDETIELLGCRRLSYFAVCEIILRDINEQFSVRKWVENLCLSGSRVYAFLLDLNILHRIAFYIFLYEASD